MRAEIDALKPLRQGLCRKPFHPLIEIAKHDLRHANAMVVHDRAQAPGLIPPLEKCGAKVHVVQMQRVVVEGDVDALAATGLARLPRQVVLRVIADWKPAEDDITEEAATQMPYGRHYPAHAEQSAKLLGV